MAVPENSNRAIELEKELKKLAAEAEAAGKAAAATTLGAAPTVSTDEAELWGSAMNLFTPILPKVETSQTPTVLRTKPTSRSQDCRQLRSCPRGK